VAPLLDATLMSGHPDERAVMLYVMSLFDKVTTRETAQRKPDARAAFAKRW